MGQTKATKVSHEGGNYLLSAHVIQRRGSDYYINIALHRFPGVRLSNGLTVEYCSSCRHYWNVVGCNELGMRVRR